MDFLSLIQAAILGVVEGLTEFLPISSTGHLILVSHWLGFKEPPGKVFQIVIQLGAILAIVWLYRARFWHVATCYLRERESRAFAHNILFAFIPTVIIGFLAHDFLQAHLFRPWVVSASLMMGGVAILLIEWSRPYAKYEEVERVPARVALVIGLCQAVAMIPGVSRSGATIMGALLCGVRRRAAAEFSFFLAVPTMLAASAYSLLKSYHELNESNLILIAVGFVTAFISALLVVRWLVGFVGHHGFSPFAWYRIALGLIILWVL